MSVLYNVHQSLYHEIRTSVLPSLGYVDAIFGEELTVADALTNKYSFSRKDLAYADASGHIDPSGVRIYDDSRVLSLDEYSVNYIESSVTLSTAPSGVVTSDYRSYQIHVMDSFPDDEEFEHADLPLVCLDVTENDPSPFAVGSSASFWKVFYFIDIFATNDPMRMNLMEHLQRALRTSMPLFDFSENMPLNYDGTINMSFDRDSQFMKWMKVAVKPSAKKVDLGSQNPKEKHRAAIDGMMMNIF
jgi:hypothetical protein